MVTLVGVGSGEGGSQAAGGEGPFGSEECKGDNPRGADRCPLQLVSPLEEVMVVAAFREYKTLDQCGGDGGQGNST